MGVWNFASQTPFNWHIYHRWSFKEVVGEIQFQNHLKRHYEVWKWSSATKHFWLQNNAEHVHITRVTPSPTPLEERMPVVPIFKKKKKKKKVKWSRYRPGVAYRVGRGKALLFHDRDTRRGWVVSSTARPQFNLPSGKTRYPFYRGVGRLQGRSGRAENLVPTGIRPRTVQPVVSRYTDWATGPIVPIFVNKNVQIELNSYQTSQSPTTCYSTPYFESEDSTTHLSIGRTYLLYELRVGIRLRDHEIGVMRHPVPRRESNGRVKKPAKWASWIMLIDQYL